MTVLHTTELRYHKTSDLNSRPKWSTESGELKNGDLFWLLREFTLRVFGQWVALLNAAMENTDEHNPMK